jgi:hypothetical protein
MTRYFNKPDIALKYDRNLKQITSFKSTWIVKNATTLQDRFGVRENRPVSLALKGPEATIHHVNLPLLGSPEEGTRRQGTKLSRDNRRLRPYAVN